MLRNSRHLASVFICFSLTLFTFGITSHVEARDKPRIMIGSKQFTEGVILGEILAGLARDAGYRVKHKRQMGGTQILWNALRAGEIDAYVEYTGTLRQQILADRKSGDISEIRAHLRSKGIRISRPLGFVNQYALAVPESLASQKGLHTIADLRDHPRLVLGLAEEFMQREDGWPNLKQAYNLSHTPRSLDQDLGFRAIESGAIDGMAVYTTDPNIADYNLRLLKDNKGYFPRYEAVIAYRSDLPDTVIARLRRLEGAIPRKSMTRMNAQAKHDGRPAGAVAADFLAKELNIETGYQHNAGIRNLLKTVWRNGVAHIRLVAISLILAIAIAIPLGIAAFILPRMGQVILGSVGIMQTIPSLALFVFMIPIFGIGAVPTIAALFVYSLLPVVRGTHSGLCTIGADLRESAAALGLPRSARLRRVEMPLAAPSILAGIKTAAVINVGIATLGALIGAGGYGQPILAGIRLDDTNLIMQGAIPAAILALLVQALFELVERLSVSPGLRL